VWTDPLICEQCLGRILKNKCANSVVWVFAEETTYKAILIANAILDLAVTVEEYPGVFNAAAG